MRDLVCVVPARIADALTLAGVAALPACSPAEAIQRVHEAAEPEVQVVILAEHWLWALRREEQTALRGQDQPLLIPLPLDWQSTRDVREDFERRLGRILGRRISVAGVLSARRKAAP